MGLTSMQHFRSLKDIQVKDAWLTIGSFDGVHTGHQEILRQLTTGAHAVNAPAIVLTFYPHPAVVLGKRKKAQYLTTPDEQAELLAELDIDYLITHPFNQEVAAQTAHHFLSRVKNNLGIRQLWVGHDFTMGHNRSGNVPALQRLGTALGFQLQVISPVQIDAGIVSSSRIRKLLAGGKLGLANRLLGRKYNLHGQVVEGQGRGRTIGIPTANLAISTERIVPGRGVYVCTARTAAGEWGAVTNIGFRPTFEDDEEVRTVEAHLLDFEGDLYGQKLQLTFLSRLRGEQQFSGPEDLVAQIHADIAAAREHLSQKA